MPDPSQIDWGLFALWYVVFLFSLTVHEGAHALAARLGGDDTAYLGGQVTLNPLPHIRQEPFGTLLAPALSFLYLGWVMGWASTPYDPLWAERHRRRAALMALAGPAGNFLLAGIAFLALRVLLFSGTLVPPEHATFDQVVQPADPVAGGLAGLSHGLSILFMLNVLLGLFNLVPLPPLDGSGVLEGLLPERAAARFRAALSAPYARLAGLLVAWWGFGKLIDPIFGVVLWALHPGAAYS